MNEPEKLQTRCVIVGGGPAGMMAGYLFARAGVQVAVLEKHADFNRDFRGDTIHPSTHRRFHAAAHALQVHRVHAAVGFSQFPLQSCQTVPDL